MTNREAHEEAAGYGLCDEFFSQSKIDPDAEYSTMKTNNKKLFRVSVKAWYRDWSFSSYVVVATDIPEACKKAQAEKRKWSHDTDDEFAKNFVILSVREVVGANLIL